jgi:hypothetical protein
MLDGLCGVGSGIGRASGFGLGVGGGAGMRIGSAPAFGIGPIRKAPCGCFPQAFLKP